MRRLFPLGLALLLASPLRAQEARTLVVALDAVPFAVVDEVVHPESGKEGLFADFRGPAPLISTFPSTTSLALAGILQPFGLPSSPGYEARFYDMDRNHVRGGGLISYGRIDFPWRDFFDWRVHGTLPKLTRALRPVHKAERAIVQSINAFFASDAPIYFVYFFATDLAGHLRGPDSLKRILRKLDGEIRRAHHQHPDVPFHAVLFSDHGQAGGQPLRNVRFGVRQALERGGFRIAQRLLEKRDVVIVPFGLVSSIVAHTFPESAVGAARRMAGVDGVDLCAAVADDGWLVVGGAGVARIRKRLDGAQSLWSYEPESGDPLRLTPPLERLNREHPEKAPWFSDAAWLEATRDADYPDPLYRIVRGFELVANPATVICSLDLRHMYGAAITNMGKRISGGRLRWTHGSLLREPSLGFLLTDIPGWTPASPVRFDRALLPLVVQDPERARLAGGR